MRRSIGWLLLTQAAMSGMATAQAAPTGRSPWTLAVAVGTSTFNGATSGIGDAGEEVTFAPYRPTMLGIAVGYGRDRIRLGLTARNGDAGIGFRGVPLTEDEEPLPGFLIIAEGAYSLTSLSASLSSRIARLSGGPALRAALGLTLERWNAKGEPARVLLGPQAGLGLEIALGRALSATIDGELGFTPKSPFKQQDLPEGFRERSTWRRTLMAGLSWRL